MIEALLRVVQNAKFICTKGNIGSYPKNAGHVPINMNNSGQSQSIYFLAFFLFGKMYSIKEKSKVV